MSLERRLTEANSKVADVSSQNDALGIIIKEKDTEIAFKEREIILRDPGVLHPASW